MKAFLMHKNSDYNLQEKLPWNEKPLIQDLELNTLLNEMAKGNKFLFEVAQKTVLTGFSNDVDTILYRQNNLKDCLNNPSIIRYMYDIAVETIEKERKNYWGILYKYPSNILHRSLDVMEMFMASLKELRTLADKHSGKFYSDGFKRFFSMLQKELDDEYFIRIQNHLKDLEFRKGILVSTSLGKGNKGSNYILRKFQQAEQSWFMRLIDDYVHRKQQEGKLHWLINFFSEEPGVYTFYVSSRDDGGIRALNQLKDEGINSVANSLAQSCDHILGFFRNLQIELGFYVGSLNLYDQLRSLGEPVSFPNPLNKGQHVLSFEGLYDACLALTMKTKIVDNDLIADNKNLVIITGANQGGKSTFLRSIGLSQLMMQCGMFVPADRFASNICDSMVTHFNREEDTTMTSGKLDEELSRMDIIINSLTPDTMLLFNESFAATNEREGSEIARQIVSALLEKHLKVVFVTHLYEFAHGFYEMNKDNFLFLLAGRQTDTTRTFKLSEGEPLQTSYGEDLYNNIFINS
jgi:DNA mismatch repair ATPase MutS